MTHWWRAYDDAIDHPKLLKLSSDAHRWAWFTLQCIASANAGELPPAADIAVRLRMKPAKVAEWITVLVRAGLIDNCDGVFRPHNWDDRQFQSDNSTPRVKRLRERRRNAQRNVSDGVTCNVSETANETPPEQSRLRADTEQSRADASAPIDEDLKRKAAALQAGVSAHFVSRGQAIPNLDRCLLWLTQGYGSGTVLGAVEKVLKRGKPISTLDYFDGAIRDAHPKAAPTASELQVVSRQLFIIEGTMEWACWERHLRETTGRGSPVTDNRDEHNRLRRGWFRPSTVPPGYDEATGERIAPNSEENAA